MTETDSLRSEEERAAASGAPSGVPSVAECVAFVELINRGRQALGWGPVLGLEFDAALPGTAHRGLSARHLFVGRQVVLDGPAVLGDRVIRLDASSGRRLAKALGVEFGPKRGLELPALIARVEEAFDDPRRHGELRAHFAQAGLIDRPRA